MGRRAREEEVFEDAPLRAIENTDNDNSLIEELETEIVQEVPAKKDIDLVPTVLVRDLGNLSIFVDGLLKGETYRYFDRIHLTEKEFIAEGKTQIVRVDKLSFVGTVSKVLMLLLLLTAQVTFGQVGTQINTQNVTATAPITKIGNAIGITPASTTTAGSMSIADKKRLDSLKVLKAGVGIEITSGNFVRSVISSDTTTLPASGNYRLALPTDSVFRIVTPLGKVHKLIEREQPAALLPIVIDSTLSSYTVNISTAKFTVSSVNTFLDPSLGKYTVYASSRSYYFPKFIPNSTIAINLPNPNITANDGFFVEFTWNTRNTINFNYPIYFDKAVATVNTGVIVTSSYGLTQMNPNLQTIPSTIVKADWFITKDSSKRGFYIKNKKWYIL